MSADNQQFGDGNDNYGQAVRQMAKAAKEVGKETAKQAAEKGTEAAVNAATASVKAAAEGSAAVSEVAAGTAAGGPVGAVIAGLWALRHTLYKILICVCLLILFIVIMIVSLPSVILNTVFGLNGVQPADDITINSAYEEMDRAVTRVIKDAYDASIAEVERIIDDGEYDYTASMEALINYAQSSAGYDVCYILSAYSASKEQRDTEKDDMITKLDGVKDKMFPVSYVVKKMTKEVQNDEGVKEEKTVEYVECTINAFDSSTIITAFGLNLEAIYDQFNVTYGQAIDNMAKSLKMTLYGQLSAGQMVELTDAELIEFVNAQNCSDARKQLLITGLSLCGKVPYFWGGKSSAGWNDEWNTPKLVTAAGSSSSGTIRPYGLDCSGFTSWVYETALGVDIGAGTGGQYPNTTPVSASDLQIGDLGFLAESSGSGWNHVLMFAGYENGQRMWVHSSSGSGGVALNSPSYEAQLVLRRPKNVDFNAPVDLNWGTGMTGTPTGESYTVEVEVTHYCPCYQCNGNSLVMSASGKPLAVGMVAMSTYYPFGTKIKINGTVYTVEDRGGPEFNSIYRVDIFVPTHEEALRRGRYKTMATIYK